MELDVARSPIVDEMFGDDIVAESVGDEVKSARIAPENEFRPADASSVAWCLSWPDSSVLANGVRSIDVDDIEAINPQEVTVVGMEVTRPQEGTVEDMHCNSTSVGDVSPSTFGVGCRWDCGSPLGPSLRPSGSTVAWVVWIRH